MSRLREGEKAQNFALAGQYSGGIALLQLKRSRLMGEQGYDGRGGVRYLTTEGSMKGLYKSLGHTQQAERLKGVYTVVDSTGRVDITTTHWLN